MQERILELLIDNDDITWKSIIQNLVNTGEIDPWDVNITELTRKYISVIKKLKELDFRVSGKVILAAALLLRIKSSKLVEEDINEFDRLIASTEDISEEEFYSDIEAGIASGGGEQGRQQQAYVLMPRNPQPRTRKMTIYDLIGALEKAFEVRRRRVSKSPHSNFMLPEKSTDMTLVIRTIYRQIVMHIKENGSRLTFSQLLPSESRMDKIYTFIPLLHLSNQRRIDMIQKKHFGDISIHLLKCQRNAEVDAELGLV